MILEEFKHETDVKRQEFRSMSDILARRGLFLRRLNGIFKVITLILGTLTAAKGTYNAIYDKNERSLVFFAIVGIVVTVITGIEATFKIEKNSFELFKLSDQCSALDKEFSVEYRKIRDNLNPNKSDEEVYNFLDKMNKELKSIYNASSNAGFNLITQINKINERLMAKRRANP